MFPGAGAVRRTEDAEERERPALVTRVTGAGDSPLMTDSY
jgi:hypothetical protein